VIRPPTGARRRPAVAVLLVTCAALAACSSDNDTASSPTTTAPKNQAASTTTAATTLPRYAGYTTQNYADPAHWVCRPDTTDICDSDLDSTTVAADGTLTVQKFQRATDPKIDCFYVYPTISKDPTTFSDWDISGGEEGFVTVNQAARLQSTCRLFAPVYRQRTLAGLGGRLGGGPSTTTEQGDPYADVLDAFRTYMARDNNGRGFVLVGHSQGTSMLNKLIKEEMDPNADVRAAFVGGYLAGGSVAVPAGAKVGGDFAHVPLCSTRGQVGCVTTWSTFRSTAPPPADSFFGRSRTGGEAGCVNPADPAGTTGDAPASSYFPADARASILGAKTPGTPTTPWVDPSAGTVITPFVSLPGLVTVRCATSDGVHYLQATVQPDQGGPRVDDIPGDLTPQWGLHLFDLNLVMGDVVNDVAAQAAAYRR
jgi:Protein of unknown function (DUF3089)